MAENNPNDPIHFYNWWYAPRFEDGWFYRFMHQRNLAHKSVNFFSVFGERQLIKQFQKHKNAESKIVFYTGENVHNNNIYDYYQQYTDNFLSEVDLSLGFDNLEADNYLRFPIWILYFVDPSWNYSELKTKIEQINHPIHRLNTNRVCFASQISRHDTNGIRKFLIDVLNNIDCVSCAGSFANNTDELHTKYSDNKLAYLENFKFNICPENNSVDYYVTEKLFHSIMAGCIPIYWGGGNIAIEPEVLNQQSFLRLNSNFDNVENIFTSVKNLYENPDIFIEFSQIEPFADTAADYIWEKLQQLEYHLKL